MIQITEQEHAIFVAAVAVANAAVAVYELVGQDYSLAKYQAATTVRTQAIAAYREIEANP